MFFRQRIGVGRVGRDRWAGIYSFAMGNVYTESISSYFMVSGARNLMARHLDCPSPFEVAGQRLRFVSLVQILRTGPHGPRGLSGSITKGNEDGAGRATLAGV